jgi:hypothetical protein
LLVRQKESAAPPQLDGAAMSGRVRWQRDGETVTGYRKTDRRNPRRDPREKLRELAFFQDPGGFPVRITFRLPKSLEGFVSPGGHGLGVEVLAGWYVRIGSHSSDQCFKAAQELFFATARDRPGFVARCIIVNVAKPQDTYARWLSVVKGNLTVSAGGLVEPRIYEAA